MTDREQRRAAKEFAKRWEGDGYEKGQSQKFWIDLLQNVFGVENIKDAIAFEYKVKMDKANGFIDALMPAKGDSTKVLIEQKGINVDLTKKIRQSNGDFLTPYEQAKKYISDLSVSVPRCQVKTKKIFNFFKYFSAYL